MKKIISIIAVALVFVVSTSCKETASLSTSPFGSTSSNSNASSSSSSTSVTGTSDGAIFSWSAVSGAQTSFAIQQSTDGVNFKTVVTANEPARTAKLSGLSHGTKYYFRMNASNAAGSSSYTSTVSVTIPNS